MKFYKQTISSVPLEGQTILLRADYNVPLHEDGTIADDFRLRASLPTLRKLLKAKCKVVIISHLGRPKGRDETLSLAPVALRLSELLEKPVVFVDETIGDKAKMAIKKAPAGSVVLLENLRFYAGEEANDPDFAKALTQASGARYFVQDGFGVVHRAHASTVAITHQLPSVAGLLLKREYMIIKRAMHTLARPLVAILGGAKVHDKIGVISALIDVADKIIITGAMANTFLVNQGFRLGRSHYESDAKAVVEEIYAKASKKVGRHNVKDFIVLPIDLAVGYARNKDEARRTKFVGSLGKDDMALDMGDETIEKITRIIDRAQTVIWNGTLGVAELPQFAHGSARVALALATHPKITSVIGGGDTVDFVLDWDVQKGGSFSHVSTGGGASLELMAGKTLPGIESLLPS